MTQTAIVLLHFHPDRAALPAVFDAVASQHCFLEPPGLLDDAQDNALSNAKSIYWQYFLSIDPDRGCHVQYVPLTGVQIAK